MRALLCSHVGLTYASLRPPEVRDETTLLPKKLTGETRGALAALSAVGVRREPRQYESCCSIRAVFFAVFIASVVFVPQKSQTAVPIASLRTLDEFAVCTRLQVVLFI